MTPARNVAVLDFTMEGKRADAADDWVLGLSDFVEMAFQREGIPILERRQIRLVLGERDLLASNSLAAETLRAARLPAVTHFVGGSVRQISSNEFALTISIFRAETATVETSATRRGRYPLEWLSAIDSLAKEIGAHSRKTVAANLPRSEFESLTWIPEAAFPFFKGLESYARGNYGLAVAWFRNASYKDKHFDQARLWEARSYRKTGFPDLGEIALTQMEKPLPKNISVPGVPIVAVIAATGVSVSDRAAFVQTVAQRGQFEIFEPASVGATAREIDLQLTGQMAAPLNERSVWLVVDSMIFLGRLADGMLQARQFELLSGKTLRQATSLFSKENAETAYVKLGKAFLQPNQNQTTISPTKNETPTSQLSEPGRGDTPEISFAKAFHLAQAEPKRACYLIGLADYYWSGNGVRGTEFKECLLDRAVDSIEADRKQADAAFWLASALWRKREAARRAFLISKGPAHHQPLTNHFAKLLKWFPNSPEATTLEEVMVRSGKYGFFQAKDRRYLESVYSQDFGRENVVTAGSAQIVSDERWLAALNNHLEHGGKVKAWRQLSEKNSVTTPDVQRARDALQKIAVWQDEEFKLFSSAIEKKETARALELGRNLLDCFSADYRLTVIEKCAELIKESKSFQEKFEFVFAQMERYREDFHFDPVTGAPIAATRDSDYTRILGELADAAKANKRLDWCAQVFETIYENEALLLENRLTAAYDLAAVRYHQGRDFEATELFKEVLRRTEGTGMGVARKTQWSSTELEFVAFEMLKKIRVFAEADPELCRCCGDVSPAPLPKPGNLEEVDLFLRDLMKSFDDNGGDNSLLQTRIAVRKTEVLPVVLYKLQRNEDATRILSCCELLGSNAIPALPYITSFICRGDRAGNYASALSALGFIGNPAACAKPILILATEGSTGATALFHARRTLERVGRAPRQTVPHLARLLYHKNTSVCAKAAQALIEAANLEADGAINQPAEQKIVSIRKWWEETGSKQAWSNERNREELVPPVREPTHSAIH